MILQDLIIFLVIAGLVVPVFKHLKVSPVLGFIIAGLFVGPYGLTTLLPDTPWLQYMLITDQSEVATLAEVGIVFLLFMIGLDLSIERLWAMRKLVLAMGNLQVLITGAVIAGVAYAWGNSLAAAIILGGCLALSSTAMVLQLLVDQGRFSSPAGHASFSILLAQDLAVVPLLFLVSAFGTATEGSLGFELLAAILRAVFTMAVIYFIGKAILKPLLHFVGRLQSPELFMATTLLVVLVTATVTHTAGLSAALGAFLAGLLLAESEYRHDIELYIEPFKGLLLGLFFMSVAMGINLATVAEFPLWILLSTIGLFLLKTTITTGLARLFGFNWHQALSSGVILGQGGEFAFVVIGLALSFDLLPATTAQFMLIVVGATMLATPLMAAASRMIEAKVSHQSTTEREGISDDITGHVILVGYGRVGRMISDVLNHQRIPFLTIDRNPNASTGSDDTMVITGDATHSQSLLKLHATQAQAIVVAINDSDVVRHIIEAAQRIAPNLPILVRAHDQAQAQAFLEQGAHVAVPEVLESGIQLTSALLQELEVPEQASNEIISQLRLAVTTKNNP